MKILQVIQFFAPQFGGTVNVVYNLSKELSKRGHDVTIITTDFEFDEEYSKSIEKYGVKVIPFNCILNLSSFFYSPSMKKWLSTNITKFDAVHMHNFRSYQNNVVYKYVIKHKIPYVLQAHGSILQIFQKKSLKKLYDVFYGKKILKNAAKLIAVSDLEKEQYKKLGICESRIEKIPNGLALKRHFNKDSNFRKSNNIITTSIILYLGRKDNLKGIDFLIKSFQSFLNDYNDVTLIIAGPDGGNEKQLINLVKKLKIENNVQFLNFIGDVCSAYKAADILVYPVKYEIFGLVPFEAILCGTPVIVTENSGCGEMIRDAGCGYLVKYGEIEDLKEKMSNIITNPKIGKKFVENGNEYIKHKLNWKDINENLEELYTSLLTKTSIR